jgi:hypothetical protein
MAQHPLVTAYYQTVKTGLREGRKEDYGIFYGTAESLPGRTFQIDKETLGPHTAAESALVVFPDESAVTVARPVFLFRDPVDTWNGWFNQGWRRFSLFQLAYANAFKTMLFARAVDDMAVFCTTYERLTTNPQETLTAICNHWGVPYSNGLLDWKTNIGRNGTIRGGADFVRSIAEGSFSDVQQNGTIRALHRQRVIPESDVQRVAAGPLREMYAFAERESRKAEARVADANVAGKLSARTGSIAFGTGAGQRPALRDGVQTVEMRAGSVVVRVV